MFDVNLFYLLFKYMSTAFATNSAPIAPTYILLCFGKIGNEIIFIRLRYSFYDISVILEDGRWAQYDVLI